MENDLEKKWKQQASSTIGRWIQQPKIEFKSEEENIVFQLYHSTGLTEFVKSCAVDRLDTETGTQISHSFIHMRGK